MIVIVGGSGVLGRELTRRLVANGTSVRVVSRDADRARAAASPSVAGAGADVIEFATADVRDPASLTSVLTGADVVVAAVQGFGGRDAGGLQAVDVDGNANLIRAAATRGVGRFVLMSMQGAAADAPLALARAKAAAEQALRDTALAWTIVRPSTYMETWVSLVGDPIVASGRARVFGRGRNPINFVSALDVAAVVERSVLDADAAGRTIEVRGPADLTFDELAGRFAEALGRPVPIDHVPPTMLRILSTVLRPIRPVMADQVRAALVMDRIDLRGDVPVGSRPELGTTTIDEVIGAYLAAAGRPGMAVPAG